MAKAYEYVLTAFEFGQMGWTLLILIGAPMVYMLFYFIEHWAFRVLAAPAMVLGAALCNAAMNDFALHFTTDKTVNQGIGFGAGMVAVMMLMSFVFWCWYELVGE